MSDTQSARRAGTVSRRTMLRAGGAAVGRSSATPVDIDEPFARPGPAPGPSASRGPSFEEP
jgi:hypothetical protein